MRTPGADKKAGFASKTQRNRCDLERGPHTKCVGIHNPSAATKIQTARVAVVLFFICIMTWVPWSSHGMTKDIENTARMGGGDYRVFCFSLLNADRISVAL